MFNFKEKLSNVFSLASSANPTQVSDKLKQSIILNLKDGEEFVHSIKNFRAFHNAKKFQNKDTFFNSWCILTDRRLLIIKNLNHFKLFIEIHLPTITDHRIEKSESDLVITLISKTAEDVIEFPKNALSFAEEFSDILLQTLKAAKDRYSVNKEGNIEKKCGNCGKFVSQDTRFCSDCGHKLN